MKREYWIGLILLALAAGLYWRSVQLEEQAPAFDASSEPDFVARALRTRSYDANGRLAAEIAADSMQHYQQEALTEFDQPIYLIYPEDQPGVWKVQATSGRLQQNRYLLLQQQVVITAIEPEEPLRTIHTDHLTLDLETMVMTSDAPIRAEGELFTLNATGLWADLNHNKIELQHDVNATYQVQ
ncbi:LPS export ABC transporter periplasmic protein LptC [Ferrimonas pelagia]|uniref:Lipopolysaccharide export system protein LptC n=1 Tax=Ferrimonas pelagia TaxID=1177826 RepID=A0ABP9FFP5_9GAMM